MWKSPTAPSAHPVRMIFREPMVMARAFARARADRLITARHAFGDQYKAWPISRSVSWPADCFTFTGRHGLSRFSTWSGNTCVFPRRGPGAACNVNDSIRGFARACA